MKVTVQHEKYGKIEYSESFWSGKKKIIINDVLLDGNQKTTFLYNNGEESTPVAVKGNHLKGATLVIGEDSIQITKPIAWYEIVCGVATFTFLLFWSITPALVSIFPIVGGMIGGAIYGAMAMVSVAVMKAIKNVPLKFLAWIGVSVLTAGIGYVAAVLLAIVYTMLGLG